MDERSRLGCWRDMALESTPALKSAAMAVENEIMAMATLYALHANGMIPDDATFIGGTALRLCHGSPRMSIDIDFHRPPGADRMAVDRSCLASEVSSLVGAEVDVSTPTGRGSRVARVSANLPERPKHVKRPVTMIDSGTGVVTDAERKIVFTRLAGSPTGVSDITPPFAVRASSLDEILVDKHLALVGRRRVKHRDVFDLLWLAAQGARFDGNMLVAKLGGDMERVAGFRQALPVRTAGAAETLANGDYTDNMRLFLPSGSHWLFDDERERSRMAQSVVALAENAERRLALASRQSGLATSVPSPSPAPSRVR